MVFAFVHLFLLILQTGYATFLFNQSADFDDILEINPDPASIPISEFGHSTFNVTANFYSHLNYQSRVSSAEVIANALGDKAKAKENEDNKKTGS